MNNKGDCIFCKIVAGQIPSNKAFEDEDVLVFHDIHPIAPVHLLVIPKEHMDSLAEAEPRHQALLGKIMLLAPKLAREQGLDDGFRTIINTGRGGHQEVFHLHLHITGGDKKVPLMKDTLNKL
jgi:histidine triad (HIT) family protein